MTGSPPTRLRPVSAISRTCCSASELQIEAWSRNRQSIEVQDCDAELRRPTRGDRAATCPRLVSGRRGSLFPGRSRRGRTHRACDSYHYDHARTESLGTRFLVREDPRGDDLRPPRSLAVSPVLPLLGLICRIRADSTGVSAAQDALQYDRPRTAPRVHGAVCHVASMITPISRSRPRHQLPTLRRLRNVSCSRTRGPDRCSVRQVYRRTSGPLAARLRATEDVIRREPILGKTKFDYDCKLHLTSRAAVPSAPEVARRHEGYNADGNRSAHRPQSGGLIQTTTPTAPAGAVNQLGQPRAQGKAQGSGRGGAQRPNFNKTLMTLDGYGRTRRARHQPRVGVSRSGSAHGTLNAGAGYGADLLARCGTRPSGMRRSFASVRALSHAQPRRVPYSRSLDYEYTATTTRVWRQPPYREGDTPNFHLLYDEKGGSPGRPCRTDRSARRVLDQTAMCGGRTSSASR